MEKWWRAKPTSLRTKCTIRGVGLNFYRVGSFKEEAMKHILITMTFMVITAVCSVVATVYAVQKEAPAPVGLVELGRGHSTLNGIQFPSADFNLIGTAVILRYVYHPQDGRVILVGVQVAPSTYQGIWADPTFNIQDLMGPPQQEV